MESMRKRFTQVLDQVLDQDSNRSGNQWHTRLIRRNPWPESHRGGLAALLLVTLLWGSTYAVVKSSVDTIPPSVITFVRFVIAALALAPWVRSLPVWRWSTWELAGLLSFGYGLQTIALQYTTANRNAFITSLHAVLLPLLLWGLGQRVRWPVWAGAGLATLGTALLSSDGSPPNWGDAWSVVVAACWAVYIWRIGCHTLRSDARSLALGQLVGVALLAGIWTFSFDRAWWQQAGAIAQLPWFDLIYLGTIGTAATTLLQAWGQRWVAAPIAAMTYTLEPVWGGMFAFWLLGEQLGWGGWLGGAAIVGAIALCQLPDQSPP